MKTWPDRIEDVRGQIVRLVVICSLLGACAGPSAREPSKVAGPVVAGGAPYTYTGQFVPGMVSVFTGAGFGASDGFVIRGAVPVEKSDALEILAARVAFTESKSHEARKIEFGAFCTDVWPPKGFGPLVSYAVEGLRIEPGDEFHIAFFVRPTRPGDWKVRGVRLTYEYKGKRLTRDNLQGTNDIVMREDPKDLPDGRPNCNPKHHYGWLEY